MLLGFEAPPSSAGVPLALHADIVKQIASIDLNAIAGVRRRLSRSRAAPISIPAAPRRASPSRRAPTTSRCPRCSARWWHGSARPRPRRCWARSAPTPRAFGPRAASRSACSRRRTATSSSPPRRSRSARRSRSWARRLSPRSTRRDLRVTNLDGRLFGGTFAASGGLWPRGAGAELEAKAELKGAQARRRLAGAARQRPRQGSLRSCLLGARRGLEPAGPRRRLERGGQPVARRWRSCSTLSLGAVAQGRSHRRQARRSRSTRRRSQADARAVRDTLTKGIYKYAPASSPSR